MRAAHALAVLLAVTAAVLVPWIAVLDAGLVPGSRLSAAEAAVWTAFDLALAACLLLTARGLVGRRSWAPVAAGATAALLVTDAATDLATASGGDETLSAIATAVAGEIPLALACVAAAVLAVRLARRSPGRAPGSATDPATVGRRPAAPR